MRKLMPTIIMTTLVLMLGLAPWNAEASIGGATKFPTAADVSKPIEYAACRGWGPWCGPGYTRVCGRWRCWCRPCW
jgi:hypothetical protein